tara:strand:- start:1211 stop:1438 length:228 start_codon:yes stop_codon:yes gene_type:complete
MTEVILPKLGFSMTEGTLAEWLVADGEATTEGTPLFALEAEKATQEIESPGSGTLRIHVAAGGTYPVGTLLGTIE